MLPAALEMQHVSQDLVPRLEDMRSWDADAEMLGCVMPQQRVTAVLRHGIIYDQERTVMREVNKETGETADVCFGPLFGLIYKL